MTFSSKPLHERKMSTEFQVLFYSTPLPGMPSNKHGNLVLEYLVWMIRLNGTLGPRKRGLLLRLRAGIIGVRSQRSSDFGMRYHNISPPPPLSLSLLTVFSGGMDFSVCGYACFTRACGAPPAGRVRILHGSRYRRHCSGIQRGARIDRGGGGG